MTQIDRRTHIVNDRTADKQYNRQTNIHTVKQTGITTGRHADKQTDRQIGRLTC